MDKETSSRVSTLAAEILNMKSEEGDVRDARYNYLLDQAKTLAGSALSQDETPGQEPASFVDRLKLEHANLTGKIDALTLFLSRDHPDVSHVQRKLLDVQLSSMNVYRRVLEVRLEDLENTNA